MRSEPALRPLPKMGPPAKSGTPPQIRDASKSEIPPNLRSPKNTSPWWVWALGSPAGAGWVRAPRPHLRCHLQLRGGLHLRSLLGFGLGDPKNLPPDWARGSLQPHGAPQHLGGLQRWSGGDLLCSIPGDQAAPNSSPRGFGVRFEGVAKPPRVSPHCPCTPRGRGPRYFGVNSVVFG